MRVDGWRERLQVVVDGAHGRAFRWGRHDCFQFAARCAIAVSGLDRRVIFPKYESRAGAEALLLEHGGARGILTKVLGEPVHCSRAAIGDLVLIDMGNGEQPALCMGLNSYAPGRRNLVLRPTLDATAAWTF